MLQCLEQGSVSVGMVSRSQLARYLLAQSYWLLLVQDDLSQRLDSLLRVNVEQRGDARLAHRLGLSLRGDQT